MWGSGVMEEINAVIQAPARQYNLRDKTKIEYNESAATHLCTQCDAAFPAVDQLEKHLLTHAPKDSFRCHVCKKCFPEKSVLDSHILLHNEAKRPHACNLCEASFAFAAQLKIHRTTHRSQGAHKCNICNKSFSIKNYLKTHMLLHKERKVHNCGPCGANFSTQERLAQHLKKHKIRCDLCRKIFAIQEQLDMHVSRQHVKCAVCQKRFVDKIQLDLHMLKHRRAVIPPKMIAAKDIGFENSRTAFVSVGKPSAEARQNIPTRNCNSNENLSSKNRADRKKIASRRKKNEKSSTIFIVTNNSVIKLVPDATEDANAASGATNTVTMTRIDEDFKASPETYQEMKNVYGQQYGLGYDMHLDQAFNYLYTPQQISHVTPNSNSNFGVAMQVQENVADNVSYYRATSPDGNPTVYTEDLAATSRTRYKEDVVEISDESTDALVDTLGTITAPEDKGANFNENLVFTGQENFSWKYVDPTPFSHHPLLRARLTELQESNNTDEVCSGSAAVVEGEELHYGNGIIQGMAEAQIPATATVIKTEEDLSDNLEFISDDESQSTPFSIS